MTDEVDEYIESVIKKGDDGSELLEAICAETLRNNENVRVISGTKAYEVPEDYVVVVHSATGDSSMMDVEEHASSMVDRLVIQAESIGAIPIGFADIIDSSTGDLDLVERIGHSLASAANHYNLVIFNGENAILGLRVGHEANVSGTMISIMHIDDAAKLTSSESSSFQDNGTRYSIFDPEGKLVVINSDGNGTKPEFQERIDRWPPALRDILAMLLDDTAKLGAEAKVVSVITEINKGPETNINYCFDVLREESARLARNLGIIFDVETEVVGDRIVGYSPHAKAFNIGGSVVSVIEEEALANPPKPEAGEYLIAIAGKPNPRANGITFKREAMIRLFGENYQETEIGQEYLEYLAEPSTVLYPVFRELLQSGAATSVYHMSGGAYDGKLAKPLAKEGLFARIENLFDPDYRDLTLLGAGFTSAENAYAKCPMGNEGFVITKDPKTAIAMIESFGLQARKVSRLEEAEGGKTGVEIIPISALPDKKVYFSGVEEAA